MPNINPVLLYSLNTTHFNSIPYEACKDNDKLLNLFWAPNPKLTDKLQSMLNTYNIHDNIIDVGCGTGTVIFPNANYILGKDLQSNPNNLTFIDLDLDFDKFTVNDNFFNFVYCRHVLEDIQNPQNAFSEITRVGKLGYIETPSPLIELTKGAENASQLRGYSHHRYIVWSDLQTNTLCFLPKLPLIESITYDNTFLQKSLHLLNNYSVYWNNYFFWNQSSQPNIIVYRNEINFNMTQYESLLNTAIFKSMEYTNHFINKFKQY